MNNGLRGPEIEKVKMTIGDCRSSAVLALSMREAVFAGMYEASTTPPGNV